MKPTYFFALAVPAVLAATSCGKPGGGSASATAEEEAPADPALAAGEVVYSSECALCHDEGEEGAPEVADAAAWAPREAKGVEKLIANAINGFHGDDGEMPARGGTPSLTDDQVASAVKYMLSIPKD